jgi:hypothetical protein
MRPHRCPVASRFAPPHLALRSSEKCRSPGLWTCLSALALGAALFLTPAVHAQSNSCDMLKAVLAERIDPAIRGYSMEAVLANSAVPTGGKVIGTCEGGASKIVYYRFGAPQPAADTVNGSASAASTAPTPAPAPTPVPAPAPAPKAPSPVAPSVATVATPAPVAQVLAQANTTATSNIATKQAPEKPATSPAPNSDTASRTAAATTFAPPFAPVLPTGAKSMNTPETTQSADDTAKKWRWILALLVVALSVALWAWRTHHNAYDEAGLPRGPKL